MLCRLPAYVGPGFPSPTTNQTGSVIGASREPRPFRKINARGCRSRVVGGLRLALGGVALALGGLGLGLGDLLVGLVALDTDLGFGLLELRLDLLGGRGVGHVDDQGVVV